MEIGFCLGHEKEEIHDAGFHNTPKPKRMKCKACGRRLMSIVERCSAYCCWWHQMPKHKPLGYKKKPKQKSRDSRMKRK